MGSPFSAGSWQRMGTPAWRTPALRGRRRGWLPSSCYQLKGSPSAAACVVHVCCAYRGTVGSSSQRTCSLLASALLGPATSQIWASSRGHIQKTRHWALSLSITGSVSEGQNPPSKRKAVDFNSPGTKEFSGWPVSTICQIFPGKFDSLNLLTSKDG